MTNQLSVVHQQNVLGQTFKVYGTVEEPLFLAQDVAEWIDHSNPTMMLKVVDDDEKTKIHTTINNAYGAYNWFLTEEGVYEVLMQSRKPIAKQWKKEVKKILKQIRLTGGTVQTDREAEFIENYFPSFSEDVKKMMVLDLPCSARYYYIITILIHINYIFTGGEDNHIMKINTTEEGF